MAQILPATDDPETAGYWAAAREGRLVIQKCNACGEKRFPPRPVCGKCRSTDQGWLGVSGHARVWTWAVAYKPMLPGFAELTPYPIAYVELQDHPGIRMAGNLVTGPGAPINSVPQDSIHVGLRVKVVFEKKAEDVTLPYWMPVKEG
jgi:uncharacterized OB-fold protein